MNKAYVIELAEFWLMFPNGKKKAPDKRELINTT